MVGVRHRERVVIEGTVVKTGRTFVGGSESFVCTLSDGGGEIDLMFLGRTEVPGLHRGAMCKAEGTARLTGDRLVIWNPLYELEQG
jgi:hypothetical protein